MKCLSNIQIQKLADNELGEAEKKILLHHIKNCNKCRLNYEKHSALIIVLKSAIKNNAEIEIPEFRQPLNTDYQRIRIKNKYIWLKVAAILIPAICAGVLLFQNSPTDTNRVYINKTDISTNNEIIICTLTEIQ